MEMMSAKYQCYNFRFWVIKGKPIWRAGGEIPLPLTQIKVNVFIQSWEAITEGLLLKTYSYKFHKLRVLILRD